MSIVWFFNLFFMVPIPGDFDKGVALALKGGSYLLMWDDRILGGLEPVTSSKTSVAHFLCAGHGAWCSGWRNAQCLIDGQSVVGTKELDLYELRLRWQEAYAEETGKTHRARLWRDVSSKLQGFSWSLSVIPKVWPLPAPSSSPRKPLKRQVLGPHLDLMNQQLSGWRPGILVFTDATDMFDIYQSLRTIALTIENPGRVYFKNPVLRQYDSHSTQVTCLKYTSQWCLVFSQVCATINTT